VLSTQRLLVLGGVGLLVRDLWRNLLAGKGYIHHAPKLRAERGRMGYGVRNPRTGRWLSNGHKTPEAAIAAAESARRLARRLSR